MRKQFLCLCAFLLVAAAINAQPLDKVDRIVPPDPEAGNLGKYGNYNLNLATGQIDISVPIYEMSGATINYPVSLSYDHQGMKAKERATSAGMNWNFNAAGVITKTVIGDDDDKPGTGYNSQYNTVASLQSSPAAYVPPNDSDPMFLAARGSRDLQPDLFSFSFGGRSGKFFYNPAEAVYYTMPFSKLRIEKMAIPGGGGYNFKVTDEQGYQYLFEQSTTTSFVSSSFSTASGDAIPGSNVSTSAYKAQWYLSSILAPDNNTEFTFEYIDDEMPNDPAINSYTRKYLANSPGCTGCAGNTSSTMTVADNISTTTEILAGNLLVSKISSPFEDMLISYGSRTDGSKRIDQVRLLKKDNTEKQKWKFHHSYYTGGGQLKLDSLILFSGTTKINGYNFEYNGNDLPNLSALSDHWGFFKGGTSTYPKIWYNSQYIGTADKSPLLSATAGGILKKIYYPTGGYTEFEFELNDYSKYKGNIVVNDPIYANMSKSLTRKTTEHGVGESTTTFQLTEGQVVTFSSSRDNCNCVWPTNGTQCIGPSAVSIFVTGTTTTGISISHNLNGAQQQQTYEFDIELSPGTYTLHVITDESMDCGKVKANYKVVTGNLKKDIAGGLRIKRIKNYSLTDEVNIRRFAYTDADEPDRSSGSITARPEYVYTTTFKKDCNSGGSFPTSCSYNENYVNLSMEPIYNLYFSNGSPIAYSRVIESIGENNEGGYIDHRFSMSNDNLGSTFPYANNTAFFWRRGLPLRKLYYTSTGTLQREELNSYTFEPSVNYKEIKGLKAGFRKYGMTTTLDIQINWDMMSYISQWYYLSEQTTKTYGSTGSTPVTEVTNYFYDNPAHIQPTRVQTANSDGSIRQVRTTYPQDYSPTSGSSDPMINALYKMLQKNIIATPVQQVSSIIRNGAETITAANLGTFKEFATDRIYAGKSYQLEIPAPVAYTALSTVSGNVFNMDSRYTPKVEYAAYNSKGKLVQALDETNRSYTITYGYNNLLPLSYTKNALPNQVYYNGFEESTMGVSSTAKYGRSGYSGIFQVPSGALAAGSYQLSWWQYNSSNWEYKMQNISYNGSGSIPVGNGNIMDEVTLRPAASTSTTISYDPGIGVISKAQDNGNGLKFNFDDMGRLMMIRDHNNNILKSNSYLYQGQQQ